MDRLPTNSSQYLYINLKLKNPDEKYNFDIMMDGNREVTLTVMNCIEQTPEKCETDIYSNNSLTSSISLPVISYKRYNYPEKNYYAFRDILLTSF